MLQNGRPICQFYEGCSNIWVKVFKNGPSKISGRQPLKNFLWSILEYIAPFSNIFRNSRFFFNDLMFPSCYEQFDDCWLMLDVSHYAHWRGHFSRGSSNILIIFWRFYKFPQTFNVFHLLAPTSWFLTNLGLSYYV